jgi:hypothetical protein
MSDGLIPNSFTLQYQNSNKLKENVLVKTAMHISSFHLILFCLEKDINMIVTIYLEHYFTNAPF